MRSGKGGFQKGASSSPLQAQLRDPNYNAIAKHGSIVRHSTHDNRKQQGPARPPTSHDSTTVCRWPSSLLWPCLVDKKSPREWGWILDPVQPESYDPYVISFFHFGCYFWLQSTCVQNVRAWSGVQSEPEPPSSERALMSWWTIVPSFYLMRSFLTWRNVLRRGKGI